MILSYHAETLLALSYGQHQLIDEDLLSSVIGQVQLVEAGMRTWKTFLLKLTMNIKFLHSIHPPQILEPLYRHSRTSSHELYESRPQLHIETLQHLEQPQNNLIVFDIVHQLRIGLQIFNIDSGSSRYHNFEFLLVEYLDETVRNQIVQTLQK